MVQFTMSAYDADDKCKICGAHMSEYHRDGCELGEFRHELKTASQIIGQFRNLLEVETTTDGFAKVAELMSKRRKKQRTEYEVVVMPCTRCAKKIGDEAYCGECWREA
jgi:hypothetical protein